MSLQVAICMPTFSAKAGSSLPYSSAYLLHKVNKQKVLVSPKAKENGTIFFNFEVGTVVWGNVSTCINFGAAHCGVHSCIREGVDGPNLEHGKMSQIRVKYV